MDASEFLQQLRIFINRNYLSRRSSAKDAKKHKRERVIYDTIHGKITLPDFLVDLLDTPYLQRLRYVGQLGPVHLLYPTATYSRFEHVIGVYWLSRMILDELHARESNDIKPEIEAARANVWTAALLHDIGHFPFSHSTERLLNEKYNLESYLRSMLGSEDIKIHEYVGYLMLHSGYFQDKIFRISREYPVSLEHRDVADYTIGQSTNPRRQFLAEVVHGTLDADRMDYLQRDSHNIGFPQVIDVHRIMKVLTVIQPPNEPNLRVLGIQYKGLQASETLLYARYRLKHLMFAHHVTKVAEEMLMAAMNSAFTEDEYVRLISQTDMDVLTALKTNKKSNEAKVLVDKLLKRQLPKRFMYLESETGEARDALNNISFDEKILIRKTIADILNIEITDVFVDVVEKDVVDKGTGRVNMGKLWRKGRTENADPEQVKYSMIITLENDIEQGTEDRREAIPPLIMRIFLDWKYINRVTDRTMDTLHREIPSILSCTKEDFKKIDDIRKKYPSYSSMKQ